MSKQTQNRSESQTPNPQDKSRQKMVRNPADENPPSHQQMEQQGSQPSRQNSQNNQKDIQQDGHRGNDRGAHNG